MSLMVLGCRSSDSDFGQIPKIDVVSSISELAEKMNVFPVSTFSIFSGRAYGSLCEKEGGEWIERYEVTFEQYQLFYDLKYLGLVVTKNDLNEAIAYLDQATSKEKALILTVIYVYEKTHRTPKDATYINEPTLDDYVDSPPILPRMKADKTISRRQWKEWIDVLKKYSTDDTVAFPAITEDDKTLKMAWEKDQIQTREMARILGMIDPVNEAKKKKDWAKEFEKDEEFYDANYTEQR